MACWNQLKRDRCMEHQLRRTLATTLGALALAGCNGAAPGPDQQAVRHYGELAFTPCTLTAPYLTTNDGLVEFNLVNSYKIYENLEMNLELDYVANFMDNSTWKKANGGGSFDKQDMWKAQVVFAYSF